MTTRAERSRALPLDPAPAHGRPARRPPRLTWHRSDDTGSMPVAVLLTIVGLSLSALLLPMVVGQVMATRAENERAHALHAAQAGLAVALGHIRAATNGDGDGILTLLPCGPLVGQVTPGGTAGYEATVTYFADDPRGRDEDTVWLAANRLGCPSSGPIPRFPAFAAVTSHGTDRATASAAQRTLRATYTLQTTNQNIAGGLIRVYKTATSVDLCLDAGSETPADGVPVQMRPCTDPVVPQQKFAYTADLTLVLVASKTAALPRGMCLDAATPHLAGNVVHFRPCAPHDLAVPTTPALWRQQWSFNDAARFEGTTNGATRDGFCFNVQNPDVPGSQVALGGCGGGYNNYQAFSPEAAVGAGAAGTPGSGQIVNFKQFGRCLDVTNQDVSEDFLIAWPCKQEPIASNVRWNQRWTEGPVPVGGAVRLITAAPTGDHCLRSPLSTAPGQYVTLMDCPGVGAPPDLRWTVSGDTGNYNTSYRIMDDSGFCLAPTDPAATPPDFFVHGEKVSKLIVAECTGDTSQKWNADPNVLDSIALKDLIEE